MDDRLIYRLRFWLALFGLILTGATWKLWTPQDVFPQIPLFGFARTWPLWLDWVGCVGIYGAYGMLLAASVAKMRGATQRYWSYLPPISALLLFLSMLLMVTLDQNRLQVWAYHFSILIVLITIARPARSLRLVLYLTASIYFWSAVSKFDYTFMQEMGPLIFNEGLLKAVGLDGAFNQKFANWTTLLLPGYEMAIGLSLVFPWFRRLGLWASLAMHVILLLALGPWGLDHSRGVLLWNVYFLGQNWLLLRWELNRLREKHQARYDRTGSAFAEIEGDDGEPGDDNESSGAEPPNLTEPAS
ncbi:MauE/DoxX family redox-associated membrane protein [Stratiformator vulcanicus]|uniref:Methylamine utilisation protein MauE domain-containing protein n=1 Tax=Stratiformator vulcanicus TaxID=2527980 RepID=A0A517R711_9PLAN|nr:MauE/DoxX family redox-associated membrane protein [Stratiformator vulcanicus]QDT39684.1 hypothetical protein Pan189_40930 [Stratiformator vulcanicus]